MATSSKVMFSLEELQKQALAAIDQRISEKDLEIQLYDRADQTAEIEEWRNRCIRMVEDLFNRRYEVTDGELSDFRFPKRPHRDEYQRDRMTRELASLTARRAGILAKSGSLVADGDGSIALTKTQLSEFFGL